MESRTRGIKAGRSTLFETARYALSPNAYAGTAGGVVVNRETSVCAGDSGRYTPRYIGGLKTLGFQGDEVGLEYG